MPSLILLTKTLRIAGIWISTTKHPGPADSEVGFRGETVSSRALRTLCAARSSSALSTATQSRIPLFLHSSTAFPSARYAQANGALLREADGCLHGSGAARWQCEGLAYC